MPRLSARFYTTGANEPVKEWLLSDHELKAEVGTAIMAVQFGWPVGQPLCKHIEGDIWEVRVNLNNRIARVLFALDGSTMILLHGFVKKTQKTPKDEIDIAQDRWNTFRRKK